MRVISSFSGRARSCCRSHVRARRNTNSCGLDSLINLDESCRERDDNVEMKYFYFLKIASVSNNNSDYK